MYEPRKDPGNCLVSSFCLCMDNHLIIVARYIKRKQEKEAAEAAAKAAKALKAQSSAADSDVFFGGSLSLSNAQSKSRVPLSPRVNLNGNQKAGGAEVEMSDTGMGIQGESGGLLMGGKGLKDVGQPLSKD